MLSLLLILFVIIKTIKTDTLLGNLSDRSETGKLRSFFKDEICNIVEKDSNFPFLLLKMTMINLLIKCKAFKLTIKLLHPIKNI